MDLGLTSGFTAEEQRKISMHLRKLFKYLQLDKTVVVGGLAIRYHLIKAGIEYPSRPFNDLDLILHSEEVLSRDCKKEFLVYHYHKTNNNFFVALVDPESRTKVDLFDNSMWPKKVVKVLFEGEQILVKSVEDQLIKTVLDVQRISEKAKVDPKQFSDARLLVKIANMAKVPKTLLADLERAEEIGKRHPEWIKEKPFRKSTPYVCKECVGVPGFPIVPMEEVYKVLGYVEY